MSANQPPHPFHILSPEEFHSAIDDYVRDREAGVVTAPLSLLFADGNNFKLVNDTYGHAMGDRVIDDMHQIAAHSIRAGVTPPAVHPVRAIRAFDVPDLLAIGRTHSEDIITPASTTHGLEGDEVAIVAYTDAPGASKIAERFHAGIDRFVTNEPGSRQYTPLDIDLESIRFGIAIGIATYTIGMAASELKRQADMNMREDKIIQQERAIARLGADNRREAIKSMRVLHRLGYSRGEAAYLFDLAKTEAEDV